MILIILNISILIFSRKQRRGPAGALPGFHKVERTVVIVKADDNDWCESAKIRLMISEEMEMRIQNKSTFDLCVAGGEEMVIEGSLDQQA